MLSYLLNSLSPDILAHVVGLETTQAVWSVITNMFTTQSMSKVNHLRTSLNSTKKGSLTAAQYFSKMKSFGAELLALGKQIDDGELVGYILNGLDGSYNNVVAAVHGNPHTTLDELYDQICALDLRQNMLQETGDSPSPPR